MFYIESAEEKADGDRICYGDTFYLRCADKTEIPLYVEIPVANLGAPVGKCGYPTARLRLQKSKDSR